MGTRELRFCLLALLAGCGARTALTLEGGAGRSPAGESGGVVSAATGGSGANYGGTEAGFSNVGNGGRSGFAGDGGGTEYGGEGAIAGSAGTTPYGGNGGGGAGAGNGGSAGGPSRLVVQQFAVGHVHNCVLFQTGQVRCWGSNSYGELGYGHTEAIGDDELPATAGFVDVGGVPVQLDTGSGHTCVVLASGQVTCWGWNGVGELGYGHTEVIGDDETPGTAGTVDVGGHVERVTAGGSRTCALLTTGGAVCWGMGSTSAGNAYGGTDNIGDDETPASVGEVTLEGRAVQLAMGGTHTCALLQGGLLQCWGGNFYGQLGYGNTATIGDDETPAGIVDVGGPVKKVVAGGNHTCALLESGSVRCWGRGWEGQLGYGDTRHVGDNETPATAGDVDLGERAVELAAGARHTCAILESGTLKCWGRADFGVLGNGARENIGDDERPFESAPVDLGGVATALDTRSSHTCALLVAGGLRCWGRGDDGRLGYGNTEHVGDDESPAAVGDVSLW